MEDDLYQNRYRTFDDLYVYCYRVASVVGLMCIEIYGYEDPKARKYAESWGIFMQLTNVLRDVGEDIHRDRVYLPSEELEANDLDPNEFMDGRVILNTSWEPYCHHYAKRARTYLEKHGNCFRFCRETRYSPAAMIAFYDKILKQIERSQGDVFTQRIRLNKAQKISLPQPCTSVIASCHASLTLCGAPWRASACCRAFDQSSGHGLASSHAFHSSTHGSVNGSTSRPMPVMTSTGGTTPFFRTPVRMRASEHVRPC